MNEIQKNIEMNYLYWILQKVQIHELLIMDSIGNETSGNIANGLNYIQIYPLVQGETLFIKNYNI